jgi:hypothetical protein
MKRIRLFLLVPVLLLAACTENYSNGERVGFITQFSKAGLLCKSWEGHLNTSQTGMNSSVPFDFSLDREAPNDTVRAIIDSAAIYGWKVKLVYHEVQFENITSCRGETNHFVTKVDVLDRSPLGALQHLTGTGPTASGRTPDTIYVVIVGRSKPDSSKR